MRLECVEALDAMGPGPSTLSDGLLHASARRLCHGTRDPAQRGRGIARTVPIIAVTANAFEEDAEQAHAAGMDAHLAKPYTRARCATAQDLAESEAVLPG
jgi:CheY-like chemotaxis protein